MTTGMITHALDLVCRDRQSLPIYGTIVAMGSLAKARNKEYLLGSQQ
jgi:hypothetical protein